MKIAVFGMGGIGGFIGGMLARHYATHADIQVYFIARGGMLDAIQHNGLTLTAPTETFTVRPTLATANPEDCGTLDLVILCTKTYHLDDAARQLAPAVGSQTVIIPLLNGVDNAERLRAHLPQAQVLDGSIYISAVTVEPGVVRHVSGPGRTLIGMKDGDHERYRQYADLLKEAGIAAEYRPDIETAMWEKYLFIEPIGSTTSYTGLTFGGVVSTPDAWALVEGLLTELEGVAAGLQVALPADIHALTLGKYRGFPGETKTSIQVDFEKGRQTELETFTGYVVRAAKKLGLDVPLHEKVYAKLKG